MSKSYCMNCTKEVNEDTEKCECGGRFFVYGSKFRLNNSGVVCDCGSIEFKSNLHMDYKHKAVTNYVCTKCGNSIGTETYRSEDDIMYWLDDEV